MAGDLQQCAELYFLLTGRDGVDVNICILNLGGRCITNSKTLALMEDPVCGRHVPPLERRYIKVHCVLRYLPHASV
jgi:hypothetical protein